MFKRFALKSALVLSGLIFVAIAAAGAAEARVFVGFGFGVPYYAPWPYYYGPPVVAYAPPVIYGAPVYQPLVTYMSQPQQNWYYCDNPQGYYPNVSTCPQGWRAVPATPVPSGN